MSKLEPQSGVPEGLRSLRSTAELSRRPSRPPDHASENRALIALAKEMACSPESILQKLADTALTLCRAHSAVLSLLEEGDQKRSFHWRAIAGQWSPHVNGGTPRDFGPCGTVLDRNVALICSHPERDFPYFGEIKPLLEEGLLVPFYIKAEAVGTIWVVAHDESRRFDAEDLRVMTNLGTFAAAAYQGLPFLNATQRSLKATQRIVATAGELSTSIAQINQPLAAMMNNGNAGLRWLSMPVPDLGEAKAALARIVNDGQRAGKTVGSIRAMFRKVEQEQLPLDVNEIIGDILVLTHAQAEDQRVMLHAQLRDGLPRIAANRVQLQQVILNLVMNAIEAMSSVTDRPRELRISSAVHNPPGVVVTVADSGTGIDPLNNERIFDAFFTTKSNGMGMGLSISRSIVEAHGGRLSVSPADPHGSVFQAFLPARQGRSA
jgi:signal transduction histidine kinase